MKARTENIKNKIQLVTKAKARSIKTEAEATGFLCNGRAAEVSPDFE